MKIYFSHGKESGPWGSKIKRLAETGKECGFQVDSIDYTDIADPDLRVELLLDRLEADDAENILLVGSSMGGYVSLVASSHPKVKAVFLLAPALYLTGYKMQAYPFGHKPVEIVHGWSDDVIPPENSMKFARQADCPLHLISGDHRLNTSIDTVEMIFRQFLDKVAT